MFGVRYSLFAVLLFILLVSPQLVHAQQQNEEGPSPRGAFLRSLVMPGWGHYYADNDNWSRGKYHLAGEAVLVLSYLGLNTRANNLENDFKTLANSKAGTNLSGKSREYEIAIGNFDNLADYNDAQLQTRNWKQVYPETAEFQWNWEDPHFRSQYQDARERVDRNRGQLPTLIALMVTNRLISGISAFIHARDIMSNPPQASFSYLNEFGEPGITASLRFDF